MTASLPRITTSSRCEIKLMQVGGDGGRRCTGTARPYVFGSISPWVITHSCSRALDNELAFVRARGHARQQCDARGSPVQRVAAALVEGQLVGDLGGDDHRDGYLLVALGDEQRHRGARDRRPARAGSAGSAGAHCGRTTRRAPPGPRPAGNGRPRPWRRTGTGKAWRAGDKRSSGARRRRQRPAERSAPTEPRPPAAARRARGPVFGNRARRWSASLACQRTGTAWAGPSCAIP